MTINTEGIFDNKYRGVFSFGGIICPFVSSAKRPITHVSIEDVYYCIVTHSNLQVTRTPRFPAFVVLKGPNFEGGACLKRILIVSFIAFNQPQMKEEENQALSFPG